MDDSPAVIEAVSRLLSPRDIRTLAAHVPEEGFSLLETHDVDLVIADMNLSGETTAGLEGMALYQRIRTLYPELPVILLSGGVSRETAEALLKAGAAACVAKPLDHDRLLDAVEKLLLPAADTGQPGHAPCDRMQRIERLRSRHDLQDLVFVSEAMERVVEGACRVANAEVPVLITGPDGAGKEHIARVVHANSAHRDGPFIPLDCGIVPAELIEAELFGVEAGAFSRASRAREGRFGLAAQGTLFIDAIDQLPLTLQGKLLRALQTGRYQPLGSSELRTAAVRVIAASHVDLQRLVRSGHFRADLFERLNLIAVRLPPLAERLEDITVLAMHFLGPDHHLADDALAALLMHDWPGNVRELRNVMERARLRTRGGTVHAGDLSLPQPSRLRGYIDELDRDAIEYALRGTGGNISRAAVVLGISRQALYRRMERFGLK